MTHEMFLARSDKKYPRNSDVYLTYYYWGRGKKGFEDTSIKLKVLPLSWFYS